MSCDVGEATESLENEPPMVHSMLDKLDNIPRKVRMLITINIMVNKTRRKQ